MSGTVTITPDQIVTSLNELAQRIGTADEARQDELNGCNKIMLGRCDTVYCLKRGGWKKGLAVEYAMATCPAYEARKLLEDAALAIKHLQRAAGVVVPQISIEKLASAGTKELLQAFSTPLGDDYVRAHTQMPRTLEGFEEYVRENCRDDVLEVIQNYLTWPAPPKPREMDPIELKAREVVSAWRRLGTCHDEFDGSQEPHDYCAEYESALDDAILKLQQKINVKDGAP